VAIYYGDSVPEGGSFARTPQASGGVIAFDSTFDGFAGFANLLG
jgi:hypothetical protein